MLELNLSSSKEKYIREKRDIIDRYEMQFRDSKEMYENRMTKMMEEYES